MGPRKSVKNERFIGNRPGVAATQVGTHVENDKQLSLSRQWDEFVILTVKQSLPGFYSNIFADYVTVCMMNNPDGHQMLSSPRKITVFDTSVRIS